MIARIVELSLSSGSSSALGLTLLFGGLYAFHLLDIVAYPDPSPMVEVITQYPGWSAEEIERQITIPLEVALNGMPALADIRSLSIFGLSDIKIYFDFDTNYFFDRQKSSTVWRRSHSRKTFSRPSPSGGRSPKSIAMSLRVFRRPVSPT
ncbi:MAG: efflux RND transporter permease subunit [Nitrospiraceae bacterium]